MVLTKRSIYLNMKRLVVELETSLHQAFKLQAMKNGQSIKDAMTDLIEYYVKNEMILKDEK